MRKHRRIKSRPATPKVIHARTIVGQQGINLLEKILLDIGYLWVPRAIEAGIDGFIEIRDPQSGEAKNQIIEVQSKAISGGFTAETNNSFEYLCTDRDLAYWLRGNAPVILVVSRPATGEAYWVSVKDYFSDSAAISARRVTFNKAEHRLEKKSGPALLGVAANKDAGIYLAPPPKEETLHSNLLRLKQVAEQLYIASTDYRDRKAVFERVR
jgi:hypothetical protein